MKKFISAGILFLILTFLCTIALAGDIAVSSFSPLISARHNTLIDNGYVFMDLDKHDLTLTKGMTATLNAFIHPTGKSITVEWKSSNPDIVKVSSAGRVTAVAPGTAVIKIVSKKYMVLYDQTGYSNECYVTVQGGAKDAQPFGSSDRVYNYDKVQLQTPTSKYSEALDIVKMSIGGYEYSLNSNKIYYHGLMFGSKDLSKAHTVIYIAGYEDGNMFGYGFDARGKSPIKTSRGITIETKKSVVEQKYGLPTYTDQYSDGGRTYEILSYHIKAPGKNLYAKTTFHIQKPKGTVSIINFYIGGLK